MDDKLLHILQNHSLDVDILQETLRQVAIRNYKTLHDNQRSMVNISRYDIPFSEFKQIHRLNYEVEKVLYPKRFVYYLGENILNSNKRKLYRSTNLYNKAISQEYISEHPELYSRNFMIFIDGLFVNTCEVIVSDDELTIVIDTSNSENGIHTDGIPYDMLLDMQERNAIVTILLVPNYSYAYASFNKYTLYDVLNFKVTSDRISNFNKLTDESLFFFNSDTDKSISSSVNCTLENDGVTIPELNVTKTKLELHGITLSKLDEVREVTLESPMFTSDRKIPLPVSSILPFTITDKGMMFNKDITIDVYYPNIYKVNGLKENEVVRLYIFYDDYQMHNDPKYKNDLKLLEYLSSDIIELYMSNSLPEFVLNYQPVNIDWLANKNYLESIYYPDKLVYNIHKLQDYIDKDPDVLVQYLYNRMNEVSKYYINIAKLSLDGRIRENNVPEMRENYDDTLQTFDEPMYVFSVRNTITGSNIAHDIVFRMFIDNLYVDESVYYVMRTIDFFHIYIPTILITETSVIEIEKHKEFNRVIQLSPDELTSTNSYVVNLSDYNLPNLNICEIHLVANHEFISYGDYNITVYNENVGEDITLNLEGSAIIKNQFTISMNSEDYDDMDIQIVIHRGSYQKSVDIIDENKDHVVIMKFNNIDNINHSNVRVFKNGRLLPQEGYRILRTGYYNEIVDIVTAIDNEIGDVYASDTLSFDYTREFHLDTIDNEYGFVDTGNSLSLPFDLKWYDVYVRGLKLNKSNIDIVTDSKFFIKGINSLQDVNIYIRRTAFTEFVMNHQTIANKLYDEIDGIRDAFLNDRDIIDDTLGDILDGLVPDILDEYEFIANVLEYTFINPNIEQITQEIKDRYGCLINEYDILYLDGNVESPATITMINSNIRSDIMKNEQNRYGFTPLHIGKHEDAMTGEYMCDPITGGPGMKSEDGTIISSNLINRLVMHKNNMNQMLMRNNVMNMSIFHAESDTNTQVQLIIKNTQILDCAIELNDESMDKIKAFAVSLDIDVLTEGYQSVMNFSDYMPMIEMVYTADGSQNTIKMSLEKFNNNIILLDTTSLTIDSIKVVTEPDDEIIDSLKLILHSILVAF